MSRTKLAAGLGVVTLALGLTAAVPEPADASFRQRASAPLALADGQHVGRVVFSGHRSTITQVTVRLQLPLSSDAAGFHGFHVHANDDPANGSGCLADPDRPAATWFGSADGHLAEAGSVHGAHAGDLPPLLVTDDGRAHHAAITDRMEVRDLIGRAVVLHVDADNLGNVPTGTGPTQYTPNSDAATELTDRTGNAGDRLACGLITRR